MSKHIADSQSDFLEYVNTTFRQITDGFIKEDLGMLHKAESTMRRKREELKNSRRKEMIGFRKIDPEVAMEKNTWFHLGRNSCEEILYCTRRIADPCEEHVDNNFVPLKERAGQGIYPIEGHGSVPPDAPRRFSRQIPTMRSMRFAARPRN